MIALYHKILIIAAIVSLLGIAATLTVSVLFPEIKSAMRRISRRSWTHLLVFAVAVVGMVMYGGRKGSITYPYTDYEQRYLQDNGSYVTNDFVHVDFTRIIAPSSADFSIAYREVASTNDADWSVLLVTTFAEFSCPSNVPFANATNYDFMAYTTWTPGPSVQTNGVWHSYWGKDQMLHTHFIPIRTCVRVDGEIIATPKSKENNQ